MTCRLGDRTQAEMLSDFVPRQISAMQLCLIGILSDPFKLSYPAVVLGEREGAQCSSAVSFWLQK